MRKVALLAAITVLGLVCVAIVPANAFPVGAIAFNGTAKLNSGFPCTSGCTGTFAGKGYGGGIESTNHKVITCAGCKLTATYTYNEPGGQCVGGKPLAALGTANGSITTYAKPTAITSHFSWTRVGVTAVVILSNPTGVSVAGFVPPGKCKPTTATIAGLAVFG
jgi:hypothetical protein